MDKTTPRMHKIEGTPATDTSGLQHSVVIVVVVAALYFGRNIFVPLALAVLLSFALAPLVSWLRRRGVPRVPAVIVVVLVAFWSIATFGVVIAGQVTDLATNLPLYQRNIEEKIEAFRSSIAGSGVIKRTSEMLRELGEEIDRSGVTDTKEEVSPTSSEEKRTPIPVVVEAPAAAPLQVLQSVLSPLIQPLATGGIVIVFVIFMLLSLSDLRDRFIRLAGTSDLHRTTEAISDAGTRVARYVLMQFVVNVTYGIPVGIGLWLIGVPNPLLWGMLTMVLRFVPFIGPIVAAFFPLALSFAVDPGWNMLFWTATLFIALELVSNNIVEPWLYGSSTGLSPLAILAAAIFWTWLWGPIGLLLSTPLTVCLVVLGRHVPQFAFLDVLLGSEPVLKPHESVYQRLLAGDPDEATERAEEFLEGNTLAAFYDNVAIPALALVEEDRVRGVLGDERRALVAAGVITLVDNLSEHEDLPLPKEEDNALSGDPQAAQRAGLPIEFAPGWDDRPVLCAGGRGNLDDAAAAMFAQLMEKRGLGTRIVPSDEMSATAYGRLDLDGVRAICLSFMNSDSLAQARYIVRRLRRRTDAQIVVGFWSMEADKGELRDVAKLIRADFATTSLADAVQKVLDMATMAAPFEATAQDEHMRSQTALPHGRI